MQVERPKKQEEITYGGDEKRWKKKNEQTKPICVTGGVKVEVKERT